MSWEDRVAIYDDIVSRTPNVERKGKTVPYTSDNGYMFSLVNKEGDIGIRLPPKEGKAFMAQHNTTKFMSHGATMRDYVLIPDELLKDPDFVSSVLTEGHQYVLSLPAKPTKKKK